MSKILETDNILIIYWWLSGRQTELYLKKLAKINGKMNYKKENRRARSVVQKKMCNKNYDRVGEPCLIALTVIYFIFYILLGGGVNLTHPLLIPCLMSKYDK